MESKVSEGLEVSGDFLKAVIRSFESHHDVHLEEVLSAVEFTVSDRLTETVKLFNGDRQKLSRVRAGSFNVDTEETRVSEVRVDARS